MARNVQEVVVWGVGLFLCFLEFCPVVVSFARYLVFAGFAPFEGVFGFLVAFFL